MTVSSVKKGISLILVLVFLLTFFPLSTIAYAEPGGFTVSELQVCVGDVFNVSDYVEDAGSLQMSYSSDNENIVQVFSDSGECHALAEGTAIVTATNLTHGTECDLTVVVSYEEETGTCGDSITYSINSAAGLLTLSGTGVMYNYGWNGGSDGSTTPWFDSRNSIRKVMMSDGITTIGDHAFRGFSNLASITIPYSVTSIGERSFELCESLTELTLPEGVTSIGDYAFVGSSDLTVRYPYDAELGEGCFEGIASAEPYGEPEHTGGEIGNISWSLESGVLTLSGTGSMPDLSSESDAPWYEYRDSITSVVISDGITTVGEFAFKDHTGITEVTLSKDITDIGYRSFYGCANLNSIVFPEDLIYIRSGAFQNCASLSSVVIPDKVRTIASYAFSGCSNITSIRFCGEQPNTIATNAFSGVTAEFKYHHDYTYTEDNYGGTLTYIVTCNGSVFEVVEDEAVLPTCTEAGRTAGTHCSVCEETLSGRDLIEATGHTVVTDPAVAATCTTDGLTEGSHCSVCNEVLSAQEVIPAGHIVVIDEAVEPTCTETGLTEGSHCSVCGEVMTAQEAIPATGHTPADSEAVEPTCTDTGLTAGTYCSECGITLSGRESVPATGHTPVTDEAVPPTCTETGLTEGSHCSVCGEFLFEQQEIPATGHTFEDEWIIDQEATCTEEGTKHNFCSVCGERITETIPLTGHSYIDGICSVCGDKKIIKQGSCGKNASFTLYETGELVISGWGTMYNYTTSVNPSPWYYNRNRIKHISIDSGITSIGECAFANCEELSKTIIPNSVTSIGMNAFMGCSSLRTAGPVGSDSNIELGWVSSIPNSAFAYCDSLTAITIPSSITSIGESAFAGCSNLASVNIPKNIVSIGMYAFMGCSNLKTAGPIGSGCNIEIDSIIRVPDGAFSDCDGLTTIIIPDSVKSIGYQAFIGCRSLTSVIIPKSVTSIGYFAFGSCSRLNNIIFCGSLPAIETNAFQYVNATVSYPHQYDYSIGNYGGNLTWLQNNCEGEIFVPIIDEAVEPTCTATGLTEGSHCSVCNKALVAQKTIPAKGHIEITDEAVEPTCTETGLTEGSHCSVCNEILVKQEVIPVRHTAVTDEAVESTCTETGLTEGSHCSICGEILVAQEVIPVKEHVAVTDEAVEPTCTETGLTEGSHCSICGKVLVAQEVIPVKEHVAVTDERVEPTCTETGLTEGSHCSICGEILVSQEVVPAKGHIAVTDEAVESTCTETGLTEGSHCSICGEVLVAQAEVPAAGHFFEEEWITDKEPTCTEKGLKHAFCSVCGERIDIDIPPKGHHYVDHFCTECGIREIRLRGACGANATFILYGDGEFIISGTGDLYRYGQNPPWSSLRSQIKSVIIDNGISSIYDYTFYNCANLSSVSIPNSVTRIGHYAFTGCSSLQSIVIPDSVTNIGERVFKDCNCLTSITIPHVANNLGRFFNGSNASVPLSLKEVTVSGGTSIPDNAFAGCSSITSIIIPDSVNVMGNNAFGDCSSLTSVTIPNSVTSIGDSLFSECNSLASITIPFLGSSLSDTTNNKLSYLFGFTPPESLKEVVITGGTCIGDSAFDICSNLTHIALPDSITDIGIGAFNGCSSLESINIPDSVKMIGNNAFNSCSSLESISIPDGVTSIGEGAFYYCSSLTSITIPDSVTYISDHTFNNCTSLATVNIPESVTGIGANAFSECSSLTAITIPDGVKRIEPGAFMQCYRLNSITIPDSVESIGEYAFSQCSSLSSITIPEGIPTIGVGTFLSCSSLVSLTIPKSVNNIGWFAFEDCMRLNDITFCGKEPAIEQDSFNNVTATVSYPYKYIYSESDYSGNLTWIRQPYALSDTMVTGITEKAYTGNALTQNIKITTDREYPDGRQETVVLAEGTDYTTEYINNKDVGMAKVRITNKQDSEDHQEYDFRIVFKDVPSVHSFSKAVYWAVDNEIAKGYTGNRTGLYGVNDTITRGQVVMFLWRAAGRPEPAGSSMIFSDVPITHSFYKAVQWAYENKITTGYKSGPNAGKFGVNDNCTRGQIVTFMLRYKRLSDPGAGPAGTGQTFNDVPTSHSFYKAIQWAYENKITTGYKDGSGNFGVNDSCTRGQCVTFLYRVVN